jgi:sialate O-acetylesterase
VPGAVRRHRDGILIPFSDVTGALVAVSGHPNAFELCGTGPGSCRYADARIASEGVVVKTDGGQLARVRYCWGDSPVCTLTDATGLPVTPFEATILPGN